MMMMKRRKVYTSCPLWIFLIEQTLQIISRSVCSFIEKYTFYNTVAIVIVICNLNLIKHTECS